MEPKRPQIALAVVILSMCHNLESPRNQVWVGKYPDQVGLWACPQEVLLIVSWDRKTHSEYRQHHFMNQALTYVGRRKPTETKRLRSAHGRGYSLSSRPQVQCDAFSSCLDFPSILGTLTWKYNVNNLLLCYTDSVRPFCHRSRNETRKTANRHWGRTKLEALCILTSQYIMKLQDSSILLSER